MVLVIFGLALGSFVNAFVWRLHEGKSWVNARSECTKCHHTLSYLDLIPLFSWFFLRGKCRYCQAKISPQYPIIEAAVAIIFVISYLLWPVTISGSQVAIFSAWLLITVGLVALTLYDLLYMLLPTKVIYTLMILAIIMSFIVVFRSSDPLIATIDFIIGSLIGGGIFYILYILSKGKWIGGGDVRLGFLLGLLAATAERSMLLIFIASLIGAIVSITMILFKRMKRTTLIPFGPFLITALFIVQFFGQSILHWYQGLFL